jgi:hypothetical protein
MSTAPLFSMLFLLSKLSIIFKEWRVMNNVDRGGVIVLFVL